MDWLFPKQELEANTHEFRVNIAASYMSPNTGYVSDYFGMDDTPVENESKEGKQALLDQLNRYNTIRGCYLGLFYQGIPIATVEKAKNNNHLTELFDIVFKKAECNHYKRFVLNEFTIDNGKPKGTDYQYLYDLNETKQSESETKQ